MAIKKGDKVKIEYVGTLDDGTEFDSSTKHGKPLEFEVGAGQIIPGLEKAIEGMKKDETKDVKVSCDEAYGQRKEELLKKIQKSALQGDHEPKPGMTIMIGVPQGQQFPAHIVDVTDTEVTIDLNHPLAGKDLNFKVTVVEVA